MPDQANTSGSVDVTPGDAAVAASMYHWSMQPEVHSCRIGPAITIGIDDTPRFGTDTGGESQVHNIAAVSTTVPDRSDVFGDGRREDLAG